MSAGYKMYHVYFGKVLILTCPFIEKIVLNHSDLVIGKARWLVSVRIQ